MGRLTKDIELKYTKDSEPLAIAKFTIAINRKVKKENEPEADFVNCFTFGKWQNLFLNILVKAK